MVTYKARYIRLTTKQKEDTKINKKLNQLQDALSVPKICQVIKIIDFLNDYLLAL